MSSDNPKASRTTLEEPAPGPERAPASGRAAEDDKAKERAERAARAKERSSSTERVRRFRERKRAQEEQASEPAETTEAEVLECGAVFALIYDMALVPVTGGRLGPLEPEQASRAGRVLVPLVKKYAPMLGEFSAEIAAVLVLGSIMRQNWREPPLADEVPDAVEA